MTRLSNRHAVITGGGTGIGAAIARALAGEGARLTLIGRRREPIEQVAHECGALAVRADVTQRNEVVAAFAKARATNGPIAILVNNAGAAESASFAKVGEEAWRAAMAVNLDAVFHCCQAALADLLAAEAARIVTIASTAGLRGYSYSSAYCAAKHGAVGLMRALAEEFAGTPLTVHAICPGFTDTAIVTDAADRLVARTGRSPEEARSALAQLNPSGRLIDPEEVAAEVVRLCLPESAAITGQAIEIS